MISKGAFTIIENTHNEILLVKRKDVPFWDLPGGKIEINEEPSHCAIRETLEETGLVIDINYLIGVYEQKKRMDTQYIYSASIQSGKLISEGPETKKISYFSKKRLPLNLIPLRKKQIQDFNKGKKDSFISIKKTSPLFLIEKIVKKFR